jgi:hypothetical protein
MELSINAEMARKNTACLFVGDKELIRIVS